MNNKDKGKQIAEWTAKGAEWCAKKLYETRRTCDDLRGRVNCLSADKDKLSMLEDANEAMAKVMKERGVKPRLLEVTYRDDHICDGYDCENDECDFCKDAMRTKTMSFYTYDISDGWLTGITAKFEDMDYLVKKVIDLTTNRVIYEYTQEAADATD